MQCLSWIYHTKRALMPMACGALAIALVACGNAPSTTTTPTTSAVQPSAQAQPTAAPTAKVALEQATLAHGLTNDYEPVNPGNEFKPEETVYLALRFAGRPKQGVVKTEFYLEQDKITEVTKDFADVNGGVLFSVGESTYMGINLAPTKPFPVSNAYRAEVYVDNTKIGEYPFSVVGQEQNAEATTTSSDTAAPTEQNASNGDFGERETYTHQTGLFSIDVPKTWKTNHSDEADSALFSAKADDDMTGVLLHVKSAQKDMNASAQTEFLKSYLTDVFGDTPEFTMSDSSVQKDGSILIGFTAKKEGTPIQADSYIWQTGDKLSVLVAYGPSDKYEQLWNGGLSAIVNSCHVDGDAPFVK